jgi:streptogramin lyase
MSIHRCTLGCGLGTALGALLAACSADAPHGAPAIPLVTVGAPAVKHARPRFLHEYALPLGAYPSSIVAGADGAMWFGTYPYYTNHPATHLGLWRITTKGKKHYFPFEDGVYDVAAGGDGRVWFTNPYQSPYNVGAITHGGTITTYPQISNGSPESIAADASGHLWFTSFGGAPDIVEIDTGGQTVATFKAKHGYADKVASGAIGLIWFNTVANPSAVGRITRRGRLRSAPIGGPNYIPGQMALGPDGRMWICDGDALAAVDRSFKVTLYTLPHGGGFDGVTAGPDGNMWATDFENSAVVRVTTSGSMTEYQTPTPNMIPFAIATGPDRNIWFTEIQQQTDVSRIGVLRP